MDTLYLKVKEQENDIIHNNNIECQDNTHVNYKNIVCIKPWGYEYLVYESNKIGMWFLKIIKNQGTSLHTHFKKDTFIIVLSGTAKLTLINNEVYSLSPMKSVFIPKNKFHALSSFSDEVYLLEIEIFNKDATFSNKNDLLRIDDKYNRKRTGYESSVNLSSDLNKYDYFYMNDGLVKYIDNTTIRVKKVENEFELEKGYNILLDGEIYINGTYLKEGSVLNDINTKNIYDIKGCTILNISNNYAFEDSKIIYSLEHLNVIVSELKRNNKKIVLTSGCFDILHVGHIHNLKEAKKHGDILIACLSCDEQIRKLKGDTRPINKYIDRINLFKVINYVDYIVLYDEENIEKEETLGNIMKCVNPYCWVKGSDYTIDKIMEKHPYLNKVILIDNIKDKSTTNIIKTIVDT
jgi:rfaE bifunctional protein nucleotidyltransferase chain/domain